jgi:uncharacterized protein with HEPN domain
MRPSLSWRLIPGTRDLLIHGDFSIDLDAVWTMVAKDLSDLRATIERIAARGTTPGA